MQARPAGTYSGLMDAFRCTMRTEGVRALYKGMLSPAVGCAPVNAVLFVAYGFLKRFFEERNTAAATLLHAEQQQQQQQQQATRPLDSKTLIRSGVVEHQHHYHHQDHSVPHPPVPPPSPTAMGELSLMQVFWAGSGAGILCALVVTPMDVVKIQLQNQSTSPGKPGYRGNLATIGHVMKKGGPLGIMQGLVPTMVRETPSFGLYFAAYEGAGRAMRAAAGSFWPEEASLSPTMDAFITLMAGGVGGTLAWASTYPFDVIKTRMQKRDPGKEVKKGMIATTKALYRNEGMAVFFRGFAPAVIRAFPANAVTFFVYELTLKLLNRVSFLQ